MRRPRGLAITTSAVATGRAAPQSSAGSAWAMEPARVPRFRTMESATTAAVSARMGPSESEVGSLDVVVTDQGPNPEVAVGLLQEAKTVQTVDVDHDFRGYQPEAHCGDKTLSAGPDFRVRCVGREKPQSLVEGCGATCSKAAGNTFASSFRSIRRPALTDSTVFLRPKFVESSC